MTRQTRPIQGTIDWSWESEEMPGLVLGYEISYAIHPAVQTRNHGMLGRTECEFTKIKCLKIEAYPVWRKADTSFGLQLGELLETLIDDDKSLRERIEGKCFEDAKTQQQESEQRRKTA